MPAFHKLSFPSGNAEQLKKERKKKKHELALMKNHLGFLIYFLFKRNKAIHIITTIYDKINYCCCRHSSQWIEPCGISPWEWHAETLFLRRHDLQQNDKSGPVPCSPMRNWDPNHNRKNRKFSCFKVSPPVWYEQSLLHESRLHLNVFSCKHHMAFWI